MLDAPSQENRGGGTALPGDTGGSGGGTGGNGGIGGGTGGGTGGNGGNGGTGRGGSASPVPRSRVALVLGGLGVLLCWIPWAGLAVSIAALLAAVYVRRKGDRVGWAVALGVWGLILGLFFSGIVAFFPPAETTEADRQTWDDFERAFEEGGSVQTGSGGAQDAPAAKAPGQAE